MRKGYDENIFLFFLGLVVQKMKFRYIISVSFLFLAIVGTTLVVHHWDAVFLIFYRYPIIGIVVTYNFPPKDYYEPRMTMPLRTGESKSSFDCKYVGRYEINIIGFEGFDREQHEMKIRTNIIDGNGHIWYRHEQDAARTLGSYTKDGKYYLRLCYGIVNCPKELPLGQSLTIKVEGLEGVSEFLQRNPHTKVILRKCFN